MKGIILAGGSGTRLYPLTKSITKQLLPVYDKPMIYYPLSVLMLAGIRDILIITTPEDLPRIKKSLGDGSDFGINLQYAEQEKPNGIAESFLIGEKFIGNDSVCLILGDNIFYGPDFTALVKQSAVNIEGAVIFGYKVSDPERYGVIDFDEKGKIKAIIEKPKVHISNYAVTGLYFYDNTVIEKARQLVPSARGELEITDIQNLYLAEDKLEVKLCPIGNAWLDAGTYDSLLEAAHYVQVIEKRQGIKIACLEEIALKNGWINSTHILEQLKMHGKNSYDEYLKSLLS